MHYHMRMLSHSNCLASTNDIIRNSCARCKSNTHSTVARLVKSYELINYRGPRDPDA